MEAKDVKVLLVEDNPDDVELTLAAFKKYNLVNKIIVARDGEEALDILFRRREENASKQRPDLILLDIKLPKVDGLEVLQQIRSHPKTQFIQSITLKLF